jgi:hypothetical protein
MVQVRPNFDQIFLFPNSFTRLLKFSLPKTQQLQVSYQAEFRILSTLHSEKYCCQNRILLFEQNSKLKVKVKVRNETSDAINFWIKFCWWSTKFWILQVPGMGESRNFSSRIESSPSHFETLSSRVRVISKRFRVESSVFPSRVKSSQIILSTICVKNFHNRFFMTYCPVPSFYTGKLKTVVHKQQCKLSGWAATVFIYVLRPYQK